MMKVFLWSSSRCVSTAFERSIRTLTNAKVFHEPFTLVYFLGPERQTTRFATTPIEPTLTYENAKLMLCKDYDGYDLIFSKELIYAIQNKFDLFLDEEFRGFKHTFLIRNPCDSIASLYRGSFNPNMAGYYFDPAETGFRQLHEFYTFVIENGLDENPVVVDAGDLLENPDETMKRYCEAVGITYEPHMTTWEPGRIPDWQICAKYFPGWHDNNINSSGFVKRKKTTQQNLDDLPRHVLNLIEEERIYYDYLARKKIS